MDMVLSINEPQAEKEFIIGKTKVCLYKSEKDAGYASAINIASNQIELVDSPELRQSLRACQA